MTVAFYVPDWWDLHDGTKLPGSLYWRTGDDQWLGDQTVNCQEPG